MRVPVPWWTLPLALGWVVACGDDGDSNDGDTTKPELISSKPADGATNVSKDSALELTFSERMDATKGAVELAPGNVVIQTSQGSWSGGRTFSAQPTLAEGTNYTVTVRGFLDEAGNALESVSFTFSTGSEEDTTAPKLVATMPVDGASDVPAALSSLRFTFDEAMDTDEGTVAVSGTGAAIDELVWGADALVVDVGISGLVENESYQVQLSGFADRAGNPLDASGVLPDGILDFSVSPVEDTTPPTISASDPAEGAVDVDSAATPSVTLTASEPMDGSGNRAVLTSADGDVQLTGTWNAAQTVISFPVSLDPGRAYRLLPVDFVDLAGNALAASTYLGANNELDFTTGGNIDLTPPTVLASTPPEGAPNTPATLTEAVIDFDEAMDPSATELPFEDRTAGTSTSVAVQWDVGSTRLTVSLPTLAFGHTHRIDLRSLQDVAGNALSPSSLGDGWLDFTTASDTIAPRVVSSVPSEGGTTGPNLASVVVTFDEPVDPSTLPTQLSDGTSSATVSGTLNGAGTVASFSVAGLLVADASYALDLSGVRDLFGNALDTGPVLGDGVLDFTVPPAPSGFDCSAPLTVGYGTPMGSGTLFTIPAASTGRNGSFSCDSSGGGDDIVIEYQKVSDTVDNGGLLLHVGAVGAGSNGLDLEVTRGVCTSSAAVDTCYWNKDDIDSYLDVPPGTYYIWIANTNEVATVDFDGALVSVEEIPPPLAEGEGCWMPFDELSSTYTPPASPAEPAVWTIPASAINSFDMDVSWGGLGSISCDDTPGYGDIHGVDAVVEYTPTMAGSVLDIRVESLGASSADLNVEVLDRCDSRDPAKVSLACSADERQHRHVVTSTASSVHIWVSTEATSDVWPGATVSVRELMPAVGETCATGHVIAAPGTITPTGSSNERLGAPGCLSATSTTATVEWYRYEVTGGQVQIASSNGIEMGAYLENEPQRALCQPDVSRLGLGATLPVGSLLCIAVPTGQAGSFSLSDVADVYTGVGTSSVSAVPVAPDGSWGTDLWLTSSPSWVFFGTSSRIQAFPKSALTSSTATVAFEVYATSSDIGRAALALDEGPLFSLDDSSSASSHRVVQLWDGSAASFSAVDWDIAASYPTQDARALSSDGSKLYYAIHRSNSVDVYSLSQEVAATPTLVGSNQSVDNVVGLAVDATYLYFVGQSVATGVDGLYRLPRAEMANPSARADLMLPFDISTSGQHPVFLDDPENPSYLYVRGYNPPLIYVFGEPSSAAPVYREPLGPISNNVDYAWSFDRATNSILAYSTTSSISGEIVWLRGPRPQVSLSCVGSMDCHCPAGADCRIDCPAGGCTNVSCGVGADCDISCIGGCEVSCGAGANCEMGCGGGCELVCGAHARCVNDCGTSGGGCLAECLAPGSTCLVPNCIAGCGVTCGPPDSVCDVNCGAGCTANCGSSMSCNATCANPPESCTVN